MNQRWSTASIAIGSSLAVAAFPSAAVAQQSRYYPDDETALCAMPVREGVSAIRQYFGSAWYDLDARVRAYAELPSDGIEPSDPIESAELRGALSNIQEPYAALRTSLLVLVDRPDFAMRLEEQILARCSVAAHNENGQ